MFKKIIWVSFIIFCSFCLISNVSAIADENIISNDISEDILVEPADDNLLDQENEEVLTHDTEYPFVEFNKPAPNAKVSGVVDIDLYVDSHTEVRYANITVENVNTREVIYRAQDTNPTDGWGTAWDTSNVANGKYYLTAYVINILDLSDEYSIIITLNNQEKNTKIVIDDATGVEGQSGTIVAHLYDGNSNILANKELAFTIDGQTTVVRTGSDGAALIPFTPAEVKNYNVLVKFNGDNLYSPSQNEMILKTLSNTTATILTINNITGNTRQVINLKADLKAPGFIEASVGKKIDFFVNSQKVGSALTDANGEAEFKYNISEVGGKYIYSAEYNDGDNTFVSSAFLFVPESEIYMMMLANKSNVKVGDSFKVSYSLFNNGPDNASNVVFRYDVVSSLKYIGSECTIGSIVYDDSLKEFKWIIDELPVGNQTLNIIFESTAVARNNLTGRISTDTFDKSASNGAPTRYLTVKSYSKLVGSDLVKYYMGSQKYRVYVYGDDGKLVGSGVAVKVTVNKKTFNLKTNSKGFVEVMVTFKSGRYTAQVSYNGLSISNKITVKPTLITKNISKKKGKVIKFTAKVLNADGKVVKGKKITFKFKGKKYKVKTSKKGIATLKLKNLKVGKYKITAVYGKQSVKNTIKIKK